MDLFLAVCFSNRVNLSGDWMILTRFFRTLKKFISFIKSLFCIELKWNVPKLDGLGVLFGVLLSVLYPLVILVSVKKLRFEQESYRYLLIAFFLGALLFYLAYIRKFYVALFSGVTLYGIDLIATGFIEEAAKLLVLIIPLIRSQMNENNGAFYGLAVGLGFGGGEALLIMVSTASSFYLNPLIMIIDLMILNAMMALTPMEIFAIGYLILPQIIYEISVLLSVVSSPNLFGIPLTAIYERLIAVLFHVSTATIIGYGLVRGKTLKYYLIAVSLHIFLDFFVILYILGIIGVLGVEIIITVISVTLFIYVLYKKVWIMKAS